MRRLQPANETKLRSACDRCHDMKNRCTRSGGIESRCDRCERLDADCVYSKKSQVGRPRTRKQDASLAEVERASRSRSPGTSTSSRLVPLEDAQQDVRLETIPTDGTLQFDFDNSASSSSASSHAAAHFNQNFWDVDLSVNQTEATHCHVPISKDSEWQLDPAIFMANSPPYGDNIVASASAHEAHVGLSPQDKNDTVSSDCAKREVNGTTDTLIRMQSQLQQLLFDSGHEASPAVDEILGLTNHLLEIVQTQIQIISNTEQLARQTNRITTLQIMTCYSYVVQLLHPIIDTTSRHHSNVNDSNIKIPMAPQCPSSSLRRMFSASSPANGPQRCGNRYPVLHLGGFNLASQPVLNEDVVQHMVRLIMRQLNTSIRSFASLAGSGKIADAVEAHITAGVLSPASTPAAGDAAREEL
ncbi:hypothetical protein CSIM01_02874 [Colletotrichum simmondsii]|uniref:Zn(2)-C6 fungal-type domain-containing protein n=1 Tax=Colletotrichum simmondsii TaxID=703756 RepID=A0A135RS82_9PEZI|nr:hypothetical protein CSIM01_02874 [Colletotrichum simmondsii]